MEKIKVFISGAISNRLDQYKADFDAAAEEIRKAGFIALNPATLPLGMEPKDYMVITFAMIDRADVILQLEGWEDSNGASVEFAYANYTGTPCIDMEQFKNDFTAKTILPDLEPCPHCGSRNIEIEDNSPNGEPETDWIINCLGCGTAFIASNDGMPCSRAELIHRWNRRHGHGDE